MMERRTPLAQLKEDLFFLARAFVRNFPVAVDEIAPWARTLKDVDVPGRVKMAIRGFIAGAVFSFWMYAVAAIVAAQGQPPLLFWETASTPFGFGWLAWPLVGIIIAVDPGLQHRKGLSFFLVVHYVLVVGLTIGIMSGRPERFTPWHFRHTFLILPYLLVQLYLWFRILSAPPPVHSGAVLSSAVRRPPRMRRAVDALVVLGVMIIMVGRLAYIAVAEQHLDFVTGARFALSNRVFLAICGAGLMAFLVRKYLKIRFFVPTVAVLGVVILAYSSLILSHARRDFLARDSAKRLIQISASGEVVDPRRIEELESKLHGVWKPVRVACAELRGMLKEETDIHTDVGVLAEVLRNPNRNLQEDILKASRIVSRIRPWYEKAGKCLDEAYYSFEKKISESGTSTQLNKDVVFECKHGFYHRRHYLERQKTKLEGCADDLQKLISILSRNEYSQGRKTIRFFDDEDAKFYARLRNSLSLCSAYDPGVFKEISQALPKLENNVPSFDTRYRFPEDFYMKTPHYNKPNEEGESEDHQDFFSKGWF